MALKRPCPRDGAVSGPRPRPTRHSDAVSEGPRTLRDLAWMKLCEPETLARVAGDVQPSRVLANALLETTLSSERGRAVDVVRSGRLGTILRLPMFRDAAADVLCLEAWPGSIDGPALFATLQRLKMPWREIRVTCTSLAGRPSCRSKLPRLSRPLDRIDCSGSVFSSLEAVAAWTPLLAACRHLVAGNWLRSSVLNSQDALVLAELTRALALNDRLEALTCSFPGAIQLLSGLASNGMDKRLAELQVAVHSDADVFGLVGLLSQFTRLTTLAVNFEGDACAQRLSELASALPKDRLLHLTLVGRAVEVDSRSLSTMLDGLAALKTLDLQLAVSDVPGFFERLAIANEHMPHLRRLRLASADKFLDGDLLYRVGVARPLLRVRLKPEALDLQNGMLVYNVDLES